MKVLILDEDDRQMPQTCDLIEQQGHEVCQVKDWRELESTIREFKPDAFVIDLMIPALGLPIDECSGGYTTGAYLYINVVRKLSPKSPFVVFSASCLDIPLMKTAIKKLKKYSEFRGVLSKGQDEERIVVALESGLEGED